MKKSKLGKAMRAVSDNKEVAEIVGISSEKIYNWSFIIGSCIAGIAGILVSLEQNLEPTMGTGLIIKGFTAAIIGGIGNVPGAILGATQKLGPEKHATPIVTTLVVALHERTNRLVTMNDLSPPNLNSRV